MSNKTKDFEITRVITKDLVTDAFQGIRNLFGLRLRGYEGMLKKHIDAMLKEMRIKYKVEWYRMIINPLAKGSAMIILYGECESNE